MKNKFILALKVECILGSINLTFTQSCVYIIGAIYPWLTKLYTQHRLHFRVINLKGTKERRMEWNRIKRIRRKENGGR